MAGLPKFLTRAKELLLLHRFALIVLLIHSGFTLFLINTKTLTFDEPGHILGGYTYWKIHDYRLNPESGVLPQKWAAIPLLFMDLRFPELTDRIVQSQDSGVLGQQFIFLRGNNPESIIFWTRSMMVLLTTALGCVVYFWSFSQFGSAGAWISLLLFIFCPHVLAHGNLVTVDVPVTLFFLCSMWSLWSLLHRVTALTILASAISTTCLFLTKVSSVLFIPMLLVLAGIRILHGREWTCHVFRKTILVQRWKQLLLISLLIPAQAILISLLIWSAYGFRYSAFANLSPADPMKFYSSWDSELKKKSPVQGAIQFIHKHRLLPEAYLYGVVFTINHSEGRRCFLDGEYSMNGWRYFFPLCFLYKTPLPVFALLVIALLSIFAGNGSNAPPVPRILSRRFERVYPLLPLLVLLVIYWTFALTSKINIGHRHILITYPALYIIFGLAGIWMMKSRKWMSAIIVACLSFLAFETIRIHPHYLAYFNQIAGGPRNGYRHLLDSSLDWGQDLENAKDWIHHFNSAKSNPDPIYLDYFGNVPVHVFEIPARILPSHADRNLVSETNGIKRLHPLKAGTYCISANMLQGLYIYPWGKWNASYEKNYQGALPLVRSDLTATNFPANFDERIRQKGAEFWNMQLSRFDELRLGRLYATLRQRTPDDYIGYSILVYHLTDADIHQALHGPAPRED